MPFASAESGKIAYRKDGDTGPVVFLIHGTGGDSTSNWEEVAKKLSRDHIVIRSDYSGSGDTKDDGRPLTLEYLCEQIMSVANHEGLNRFSIAGFSLGAAVAAQIAADHPNRINSLILIAGFAKPDPRLKIEFELWRDLIATNRLAMARLVLLTGFGPDALSSWGFEAVDQAARDIVATQNWEGMARQVELDLTLDISDVPERITAPTLVIGSIHDHMVPPSHSKALRNAIKGASYVELPTGHLAPMERPDLTSQEIRRFLSRA